MNKEKIHSFIFENNLTIMILTWACVVLFFLTLGVGYLAAGYIAQKRLRRPYAGIGGFILWPINELDYQLTRREKNENE